MNLQDPPRRTRADGERSRQLILETAARLATVEGIDGLSIGRLAQATGMSKSGLFAHFSSKEELQLAAIGTARSIFLADVVAPAEAEPPGLARLERLCEGMLSHIDRRVFPGGCFFAVVGSEQAGKPGPVLDRVVEVGNQWVALLAEAVKEAQERGELDDAMDPEQLAFELNAYLQMADLVFQLGDPGGIERGRDAIRRRLA
jgi:AcrR family transcriptional regulator